MARDSDRFASAGTAEDPFTAQAYAATLRANGIPVLLHEARSGAVDILTQPASDFWDIQVPEPLLTRARALILEEAEREQASQADAEQAAEEEALLEKAPE
jgi:hypothetical protein